MIGFNKQAWTEDASVKYLQHLSCLQDPTLIFLQLRSNWSQLLQKHACDRNCRREEKIKELLSFRKSCCELYIYAHAYNSNLVSDYHEEECLLQTNRLREADREKLTRQAKRMQESLKRKRTKENQKKHRHNLQQIKLTRHAQTPRKDKDWLMPSIAFWILQKKMLVLKSLLPFRLMLPSLVLISKYI